MSGGVRESIESALLAALSDRENRPTGFRFLAPYLADALLPVVERVVAEARAEALREHCAEVDDRALMVAEERGLAIGRAEVVAQVEAVLADLDRSTAGDVCMNHIRKDERRGCAAEIRAALGRQAGGGE